MRKVKSRDHAPLILVLGEYYQHRETLVMAELKEICRAKDGRIEYHLTTEDGQEIQDSCFSLYWDAITQEEYLTQ